VCLLVELCTAVAGLAVTAVLAVPFLVALLWTNRLMTAWQRARFAALLGVRLAPPVTDFAGATWWQRSWSEARSRDTWGHVAYHLAGGLVDAVATVLSVAWWATSLLLVTLPATAWTMPGHVVTGAPIHDPATLVAFAVAGLILLALAPWVVRAFAAADVAMARGLLQPHTRRRVAHLEQQVRTLEDSRTAVVDAADAERRRIERDLHDGAQQRLVSLAMNLGVTRMSLDDAPEPVRVAVVNAHEEAKLALRDLRGFIRGLHPAVLDDLGLDAALSGLAVRSRVPVAVRVDLTSRPSRTVEAVAYFVVSEALTNVAKHAGATSVDVCVEEFADRAGAAILRVTVRDDGRGGANQDGATGTGLRGLRQRVGSVDGTLRVDSPAGGLTRIIAEMPCAS
jgi:signal transduction histidine kinase